MERYKVILVDDEEEVIDVMEAKIRWNELGFEVVGSATNGVKALELVEKLQPDVVLTDIKMPYMDGLELARRVRADYPNIYIMLCTGFDEFEYAKEAVHLEIKEYMLKPINAVELSECLTRLQEISDSISDRYEGTAFLLCCISYFGESCTGGDGFAAFVHVGRPGNQAEAGRKMEVSGVYLSW